MLVKMKNMFIIDEGIIQTIIDMFSTIFSNKYEHIMLCSNTSFPNQCVLQYWQLGYRMLRFERPRPCGPGCFADAWVGSLGHPTAVFGFGLGPSPNTKPVHTIDGWMDIRSVNTGPWKWKQWFWTNHWIIESNKLDHISTAYEQRPLGSFFLQYQAGSGSIIITLHILVTKLSNSVIILMKAMWFSVSECDLCF